MEDSSRPSLSALLGQLRQGVLDLEHEPSWRSYLAGQARFPQYSFANTLLILQQRPDATAVAGFSTWRSLGRTVRKGERAIWIVAPLRRRGEDGRTHTPHGYRRVAVFDISQTDGDQKPSSCNPLDAADGEGHLARLEAAAAALGFSVEFVDLAEGLYGDCTFALRRIRVARRASGAQQVKTLAHELAHAVMHEGVHDRPLAELEAESVAYLVCQRFGIESAGYTFGYVASWSGGTASAEQAIRASCRRITDAARQLLRLAGTDEPEERMLAEEPAPGDSPLEDRAGSPAGAAPGR